MSKLQCPNCTKLIEPGTDNSCPECGQTLPAADPMATQLDLNPPDRTIGNLSAPPPTAVQSGDAEYLQKGVMSPPSYPGTKGKIGKFEILKTVGKGGMGYVYLAREPLTETLVAVKVLQPRYLDDPRIIKSFLAEARHMYGMSHPAILKVLEVAEGDEGPYFAMPFIKGGSLDEKLSTGMGLEKYQIMPIATDIAAGLAYAHSKGIIHRDLKPANILLTQDGRALLTDFGLVRTVFNDSIIDVAKASAEGTPPYMSPGVAAGNAEDTRCDIYSFGAMLYEMISGRTPYRGRSVQEILDSVIAGPPEPLATVKPHAPKDLVAICEWCMARELRDRYASMNDVSDDLFRILAGNKPRGPGAGSDGMGIKIWASAAAAVCVVAIIAWCCMAMFSSNEDEDKTSSDRSRSRNQPPPGYNQRTPHGPRSPASIQTTIEGAHDMTADQLLTLSEQLWENGDVREATNVLRIANQKSPKNEAVNVLLFQRFMFGGHSSPARDMLLKWLRLDPGNETALKLKKQLETSSTTTTPPGPPGGRLPQGPSHPRRPPPRR